VLVPGIVDVVTVGVGAPVVLLAPPMAVEDVDDDDNDDDVDETVDDVLDDAGELHGGAEVVVADRIVVVVADDADEVVLMTAVVVVTPEAAVVVGAPEAAAEHVVALMAWARTAGAMAPGPPKANNSSIDPSLSFRNVWVSSPSTSGSTVRRVGAFSSPPRGPPARASGNASPRARSY
jgi:hypothetical protein